MYDYLIVGGGVVGCSIARVLSEYDAKTLLLEAKGDVATGASGANSGIVHAGYDCKPGTLMARFNVEGNALYDAWCKDLGVPFRRQGTLVLAFDDADRRELDELYKRGQTNGVPKLSIIDADRIRELEPAVSKKAVAALYAETGGIVNPYELTIASFENARANGVEFLFDKDVCAVEKNSNGFMVQTADGARFETKILINAAGINSGKIAALAGDDSFQISARRGEYILFDKKFIVTRPIFQTPSPAGKGVLVAPTAGGNVFVGPTSVDSQPNDSTVAYRNYGELRRVAEKSVENLPFRMQITSFAGVRAASDTGDFVIGFSPVNDKLFHVAGICSPGLTSAPAIAEYVAKCLAPEKKNKNYNPLRAPIQKFNSKSLDGKRRLIEEDVRYASVVCRCETVTEAEVVEAVRRGATTLDGIKRRTRCGMGRCQGGFCTPRLIAILSRELHVPPEQITKKGGESYIVYGDVGEVRYED